MTVAYVLDEVFAEAHRPPIPHPERPERILAVRDALHQARLEQRGTRLPVRAATEEELGRVHTRGYIESMVRDLPGKRGWLDEDTYFSAGTWSAAVAAAAAVIDVTTAVLHGRCQRGMALVRPPGHHAEADRPMGFCLFNNVAIAAAAARAQGVSRVAVLDWDVHHGNGTQNIFYRDPSVLYLSSHQFPYYPGTGAPEDIGTGPGAGATINVGLPGGSGDREYMAVFDEVFVPALRQFRPDIILISAGFDPYVDDPLAGMRVTRDGFYAMAARMRRVADEVADGRIVCALEGGYHLEGLADGVVAVLEVFEAPSLPAEVTGERQEQDGTPAADIAPKARQAIERTRAVLARHAREADGTSQAADQGAQQAPGHEGPGGTAA